MVANSWFFLNFYLLIFRSKAARRRFKKAVTSVRFISGLRWDIPWLPHPLLLPSFNTWFPWIHRITLLPVDLNACLSRLYHVCHDINTGCHGTVFCVAMVFWGFESDEIAVQSACFTIVSDTLSVVAVIIVVAFNQTERVSSVKLHVQTQPSRRFPCAHPVTVRGMQPRNHPQQHNLQGGWKVVMGGGTSFEIHLRQHTIPWWSNRPISL